MSLEKMSEILAAQLNQLLTKGTGKGEEYVISGLIPSAAGRGPRCHLEGYGQGEFLRMNSNSYLGLSLHPKVIDAEEKAVRAFGTGPGAVRFISGTHLPHVQLESRLAEFHGRQAAMIFSAAYATIMGVLPQLLTDETMVISDSLNHNSIINAVRLARPAGKYVYRHLDMGDLEAKICASIGKAKRILVASDGIFSMRGDVVPLNELTAICKKYEERFTEGIVTFIDDSHGVGAFGQNGRGVEEATGSRADILVATLGKAFGVNGGYVVANQTVIDYLRETAPFYIYSNPITPSEAAAALQSLCLLDGSEGREMLGRLRSLTRRFEAGLLRMDFEIIEGEHPIVPLMVRDTRKTKALVQYLFENNILATGLNYPVVPEGDQEIRFQISASHTEQDLDWVLDILGAFSFA
ncbi:aminotransferase class I/II-fold pyridoxal phosphate-dependent enzyme [Methanococcoides sp. SA1]|nr:aminotransferase class I/II-fold pyridoxal phosphate-dependent enzyme [Methanococcoides sp. SA1]